jgi:hypothetical protein
MVPGREFYSTARTTTDTSWSLTAAREQVDNMEQINQCFHPSWFQGGNERSKCTTQASKKKSMNDGARYHKSKTFEEPWL